MVDSLNDIHQFLDDNPGEVVILFIEPYVSPQAIEQVFKEAGGLDQMAAVLDRNAPLPTLGQLVRSEQAARRLHRERRRRVGALVPGRLLVHPGHASGREQPG